MTRFAMEEKIEQVLKLSVIDYLHKPFDVMEAMRVIEKALGIKCKDERKKRT